MLTKITYQYYLEQKWDSIIIIGKQAIKSDIDFYYLRYRMGRAYFQTENYALAILNFEKFLRKQE